MHKAVVKLPPRIALTVTLSVNDSNTCKNKAREDTCFQDELNSSCECAF